MSKVSECCGAPCAYEDHSSGPCWGEIDVVDEIWDQENNDSWWIHACTGHAHLSSGGEYIPQTTTHGCKYCKCKNKKA